jgi:hypothetical protein
MMIWCLLGAALLCTLLILTITLMPLPHWQTLKALPPGLLIRGCLVLPVLLLTITLIGLVIVALLEVAD